MPYKDCVICKNKSFHIKTVDDWDIYKCENCGLEFTMPMPTEDILQNFYSNYYDIRQEADVSRKNAVKNINRLKKYGITKSDIHLLDIGCGGNYFTEYGTDRWMGYDKFIKDEIDIEDFEEYTWDFVTIWGTLEHITNPVELFKSLYKCMNDKAKIIFRVLTIESSIPYRYKPPEHVTYWTRKAIDILFEKTGFKINDIRHDSFKYRYIDGSAMLNHFLIKLAFISGWKSILKIKDQENIFDQVENKLNKSARKKGELTLTIPFVTIDCIKV